MTKEQLAACKKREDRINKITLVMVIVIIIAVSYLVSQGVPENQATQKPGTKQLKTNKMTTITINPESLGTALKAIELGIKITLEEQNGKGIIVSGEPQSLFNLGIMIGYSNLMNELRVNQNLAQKES